MRTTRARSRRAFLKVNLLLKVNLMKVNFLLDVNLLKVNLLKVNLLLRVSLRRREGGRRSARQCWRGGARPQEKMAPRTGPPRRWHNGALIVPWRVRHRSRFLPRRARALRLPRGRIGPPQDRIWVRPWEKSAPRTGPPRHWHNGALRLPRDRIGQPWDTMGPPRECTAPRLRRTSNGGGKPRETVMLTSSGGGVRRRA